MEKGVQLFKIGWLYDGSGGNPRKNVLLEIKGGLIVDITDQKHIGTVATTSVTDLSNCCVLPPFVDSHVHLCMSGTLEKAIRKKQLKAGYSSAEPVIKQHLDDHFLYGIIAVRDGGDRFGSVLRYKRSNKKPDINPVIIKSAGKAWYQKGRYGGLIGIFPEYKESLSQAFVREKQKSDHLKLVNSGLNSLDSYGKKTRPQFEYDELKQTVRLAVKNNLKVMVHANGKIPVKEAVMAGCHSIEHGFFMGKDNLRLMAELQSYWVPTVYTMKAYMEAVKSGVVQADHGVIEKMLEHQVRQLSMARTLGVKVAVGTDSGSSGVCHGASFGEELKLFLEAGYSMSETIRCASHNGIKLLGITDEYGVISKGRPGHFLAVRSTPSELSNNFSRVNDLYIYGLPVQR